MAPKSELQPMSYQKEALTIIVLGASGDLAKKKTYPSMFNLFKTRLLPSKTQIWGYARSPLTHDALRERLKPFLIKDDPKADEATIDAFLASCFYHSGSGYGDKVAFGELDEIITKQESEWTDTKSHNRLMYFALPPNVFSEAGAALKETCMAKTPGSWTRLIVEKPFGRDLESCKVLLATLDAYFREDQLYRIDHYLGKEMVQNLMVMRFGNLWFERMMNRDCVQSVFCTFKEDIGTEGRGGYFDKYGIIRDIIQNHLIQVFTLLAMEAPIKAAGPDAADHIRDAKVSVLKAIEPLKLTDCLLGQYNGYTDDPTIKDKNTNCPTFALVRLFVNTPRWAGVPFIFKAGKALDDRKAEMRIQFKDAPGAGFMFEGAPTPRNELVIRMQPNEAMYMKTNVKSPGFATVPVQSELEVNYSTAFYDIDDGKANVNPGAYARLILDAIQGNQASFVRSDELISSWKIFTPVLKEIEEGSVKPEPYEMGSRGPDGADEWVGKMSGFVRSEGYKYRGE
jgi:glucose-6-phosphate 1-dehydrogenase